VLPPPVSMLEPPESLHELMPIVGVAVEDVEQAIPLRSGDSLEFKGDHDKIARAGRIRGRRNRSAPALIGAALGRPGGIIEVNGIADTRDWSLGAKPRVSIHRHVHSHERSRADCDQAARSQ